MRGHLKKRTKISWTIVIDDPNPPDGKRRRKWIAVRGTKQDAQSKLNELLHDISSGTYVVRTPKTFSELLNDWLHEHAEQHCSPKTVERYRQMTGYVLPTLGHVKLHALSTLALERLYNNLRDHGGKGGRPLAAKTVRHIASMVSSALGAAIRWRLLKVNPASSCQLPKVEQREAKILEQSEIEWMLAAAQADSARWLYAFLVLAIASGARRGELLAFTWTDINFETAVLSISKSLEQTKQGLRVKTPKNRKNRTLPLPRLAIEVLRSYRLSQEEFKTLCGQEGLSDVKLVFSTPDGGFLKPDSVTAKVCLLARKCGLKGISLHSLRHTHGSQLLSVGVPITTVSKRLGHSSVNVTASTYLHSFDKDETAAAEKWDALMHDTFEQSELRQ